MSVSHTTQKGKSNTLIDNMIFSLDDILKRGLFYESWRKALQEIQWEIEFVQEHNSLPEFMYHKHVDLEFLAFVGFYSGLLLKEDSNKSKDIVNRYFSFIKILIHEAAGVNGMEYFKKNLYYNFVGVWFQEDKENYFWRCFIHWQQTDDLKSLLHEYSEYEEYGQQKNTVTAFCEDILLEHSGDLEHLRKPILRENNITQSFYLLNEDREVYPLFWSSVSDSWIIGKLDFYILDFQLFLDDEYSSGVKLTSSLLAFVKVFEDLEGVTTIFEEVTTGSVIAKIIFKCKSLLAKQWVKVYVNLIREVLVSKLSDGKVSAMDVEKKTIEEISQKNYERYGNLLALRKTIKNNDMASRRMIENYQWRVKDKTIDLKIQTLLSENEMIQNEIAGHIDYAKIDDLIEELTKLKTLELSTENFYPFFRIEDDNINSQNDLPKGY